MGMEDDKVADMVLMIPNEDFLMKLLLLLIVMEIWNYGEVAIGVMDMEDDKVADMVLKFPYEDFTDVIVAIGDTYGR